MKSCQLLLEPGLSVVVDDDDDDGKVLAVKDGLDVVCLSGRDFDLFLCRSPV